MYRIMAEGEIGRALKAVVDKINAAANQRSPELSVICPTPRLVAVSKAKPKEHIMEAYSYGQRHFGENYIQELIDKSCNEKLLGQCPDIKWHLIGHVQSNKIKKVIQIPHLFVIEAVDSSKLATAISVAYAKENPEKKLKVFVQVNTSGEENKSGASPADVPRLVDHIISFCPNLEFSGLMTIGSFDHDLLQGPNPDFQCLLACRASVCEATSLEPQAVELSMGMSGDFEHAIEVGSTNVRVGRNIFGTR